MSKVVVYGDVSLDAVDGSSIWLVSITEVLSKIFDEVHLQLKLNPKSNRLLGKISSLPNVTVHDSYVNGHRGRLGADPLSPKTVSEAIERLVRRVNANAVVARGFDVCHYLSRNKHVSKILWSYITDLPYPVTKLSQNNVGRLQGIALRSRRMFAQTEASRSYLENIAPQAAGKTVLLPPMIPDYAFESNSETAQEPHLEEPLELVYSGKLAKDWKTLEILDLPLHLRDHGINARLTIIGDKYLKAPGDPQWLGRMREGMKAVEEGLKFNVRWLGGLDRASAIRAMARADIGIGWRSSELDSSLEISTKALEYSAAGVPAVLNLSADHVSLFGADYPYFVQGNATLADIARVISRNRHRVGYQRERVRKIAEKYSFSSAQERLWTTFERAGAVEKATSGVLGATKLAVVSHDFKFMGEVMDHFFRDPRLAVKVDGWESLHKHDTNWSRQLVEWADVVICDWAGPSAVWYSKNKRRGTRLFVRLHAFELRGGWMPDVDWDAVDKVIFVSELYRQKAIDLLGLDVNKTEVIPNAIDWADFDRSKLEGSEYNIGLVGIVGFGKRPDRALDCLENLLEYDPKYRLFIKSRPPWEYPYEWNRPLQRQLYLEFFSRIRGSDRLKNAVVFEDFSPDIASWFRKIGFVLSPSAFESFHLAPAEGMASGAAPVFWEREGVNEIFAGFQVVKDSRGAARYINSINANSHHSEVAQKAQEYVQRWDFPQLQMMWDNLVLSDTSFRSPPLPGSP